MDERILVILSLLGWYQAPKSDKSFYFGNSPNTNKRHLIGISQGAYTVYVPMIKGSGDIGIKIKNGSAEDVIEYLSTWTEDNK